MSKWTDEKFGWPFSIFSFFVCCHCTTVLHSCRYEGNYQADSKVVQWLWTVVNEMSLEDKRKFLKFFTGSDRAPIGGLGRLTTIVQRAGPDSDRLPTAHTCFNTLLLPEYGSRGKLRTLLHTAIQNAAGFGLE